MNGLVGDLGIAIRSLRRTPGQAGAIVLILGLAIGILYAVIATLVREQTRDIGIRMALGASPTRVGRGVLGRTLLIFGLGPLVGVAAAPSTSHFLQSVLFEVSPTEPLGLVGAVALLLGVALLAAFGTCAPRYHHRSSRGFARRMTNSLSIALVLLGMSDRVATAKTRAGAADSLEDKVDAIFARFKDPTRPGCAIGIYRDGKVVLARAYGSADLERQTPLTTTTLLDIGSVSKQFTAFAVLLLVEDGKLSLDDDVRQRLPELVKIPDGITIRRLLQHTSGLRDPFVQLLFSGWRIHDVISVGDMLAIAARQRTLNFDPGSDYQYNTGAYALLAEIVRRASGMAFSEFMRRRVFEPLGMTRSVIVEDHQMVVPNRALAYSPVGKDVIGVDLPQSDFAGATGVYTTVEDLARWIANFEAPTVGRPATFALARTPARLGDGTMGRYGLGLFLAREDGKPVEYHSGGDAGYRAHLIHLPEQRVGVSVLCNQGDINADTYAREVLEAVIGKAAMPTANQPDAGPPGVAGRYWSTDLERMVELRVGNGGIEMVGAGPPKLFLRNGSAEFRSREAEPETLELVGAGSDRKPSRIVWKRPGNRTASFTPLSETETGRAGPEYAGRYWSAELGVIWEIASSGSGLAVSGSKIAGMPLTPVFPDAFRSPQLLLRFTRDRSGAVTGFLATDASGRVRRMPFVRTAVEQ